MAAPKSRMAWGVVGTGDISRSICADLTRLETGRVRAVCSRNAAVAESFRAEYAAERAYGDLEEMLADDALDIVYIGTPHATHLPIALAALRAGRHVLIEKPMGLDAAEARTIADAARRSGRFAMEAMWMKFAPAYRELVDSVRAGSIGQIRSVRASFGLPFDAEGSQRWSRERASSTLLDQGIYPVTLAIDVLGVPSRIRADQTLRGDGVDLLSRATFDYSGGRFADLAASMIEYIDPTAAINGTDGWIDVAAPFWATTRFTTHAGTLAEALGSPQTTVCEAEGNGYVPMLRAVTEAVVQGALEHPLHTLDASIQTFTVLDRIRSVAHTTFSARPVHDDKPAYLPLDGAIAPDSGVTP